MTDAARIIDFPVPERTGIERATVVEVTAAGHLRVQLADGIEWECELLHAATAPGPFAPGDRVLVLPPAPGERACVLGRIGTCTAPQPQARLTLEATEVLTLKCGEVSIDLRAADGKLMLRGEDVLLRAKGTQRIRAGNVAIN